MKDNKKMSYRPHSPESNNPMVRELLECAIACETCATASLQEREVNIMTRCIELSRECAEICVQAARFMERDSEILPSFLRVCEEACRMCAE